MPIKKFLGSSFHILHPKKGFTLIELLVTISIIAVLSTVAMVAYGNISIVARNSKRVEDLKAIRNALETYKATVGTYPKTADAGSTLWNTECLGAAGFSNVTNDQVIPGIVPNYMPTLPRDPAWSTDNAANCYAYWGKGGTEYKFVIWGVADLTNATDLEKMPRDMIDPMNPNAPNPCSLASDNNWKLAIFTTGLRCNDPT